MSPHAQNTGHSDKIQGPISHYILMPWLSWLDLADQRQNKIESVAEASMGCLHLQVDSICLGHTLAIRNLLCRVHVAPNLPIHVFGHLITWPLTFGTTIFQKCSKLPQLVFSIDKNFYLVLKDSDGSKPHFCPYWSSDNLHVWPSNFQKCWYIKWSYGSKPVILPIFGQVVNLAFELCTSNFQKCSILPK